ncbi:MAG: hypothetical protein AAF573_13620 [Bacteroidota bacterium]
MRGIGVPSTRDQRSRKEKEQVKNVKLLLNHSLDEIDFCKEQLVQ